MINQPQKLTQSVIQTPGLLNIILAVDLAGNDAMLNTLDGTDG